MKRFMQQFISTNIIRSARTARCGAKTDFPENASKSEKQQATVGALVDLESAVRMYVLDEIVKNLDAGTFNMYVDLSPSGSAADLCSAVGF